MQPLRVEVQPGTAYELLLSAVLIADRSTRTRLELAPTLQRRARRLDPAIAASIRRIGREPFISLMGWAQATLRPPSMERLLPALRTADPHELRLTALGYHRRAFRRFTPAEVIEEAAAGDAGAIRAMRRTSYPELPHWQLTLRHLLAIDDGAFQAEVVGSLEGWSEGALAELEPNLASAQEADIAFARQLVATHDLGEALETLAPGIVFSRELDQALVVLVPSTVVRPSYALTDYGSTLVIAYPLVERNAPDAEIERLAAVGNALGDPVRIRVLRELASGPLSTSELARRLGVPRTSLQHHVSVLLAAGLAVMSVDDAQAGLLDLRPGALSEIGPLATSLLSPRR